MKKALLFTSLAALLFVAGCSTAIPSTPDPHPEKYTLQILQIETPTVDAETTSTFTPAPPVDVDALLKNPKTSITEFPIVYAAVGETATNDQTKPYLLPDTYEIHDKDGQLLLTSGDEIARIGRSVEFTVFEIKDGLVSYQMKVDDHTVNGSHHYDLADKKSGKTVAVSLPSFNTKKIDTKMKQYPGNWISMGGLTTTSNTTSYFAVRILPPQE